MLDDGLRERCGRGFRHNEHSLRVVDVLERDGRGLNLTEQVRDGILNHTGARPSRRTLEGRIVRLVDRVAYINHDIDDALRAGVLAASDLPAGRDRSCSAPTGSARIDTLVHDIVEHSAAAGDIVQSEEVGGGDAAAAQVHVRRVYLGPGGARRARPRRARRCAASSTTTCERPRARCPTAASAGRRATASGSPTTSPG